MKKNLILAAAIMILFSCAACVTGKKIIGFKPNEILSVEVYDVHGSSSKRKIVTDDKDIKVIIDTLSAIKIKGDGASAEQTSGGAIQFVFIKSDGSQFGVSYTGTTIATTDDGWYEIASRKNIFSLWSQLKYDEQVVNEYEMPFYPKNQVPRLGLSFVMRGDIYNTGAMSGGYSWSYDNGDGTTTSVIADSAHTLDSFKEMTKIEREDNINEIELIFSMPPSTYTVRRWSDIYIGDAQAYDQYYETITVSNNIITLSDDGKGYVYEIFATWPQGNAYYSFFAK